MFQYEIIIISPCHAKFIMSTETLCYQPLLHVFCSFFVLIGMTYLEELLLCSHLKGAPNKHSFTFILENGKTKYYH